MFPRRRVVRCLWWALLRAEGCFRKLFGGVGGHFRQLEVILESLKTIWGITLGRLAG
jgi:hypothetical protein